jgi:carbonic anhydrase
MNFVARIVISTAFSTLAFSAYAGGDKHTETPHWTYSGEQGPDHWADLNPSFSTCRSGHEQSPVNLAWRKPSKGRSLRFYYNETPAKIIDNGHTVQVNFSPGSKVDIDGKVFDLVQFHFHTQSEHTLSGKHFPLELHFVHKNDQGQLAVVGVLFQLGKENPWIEKLWKEIPRTKEVETQLKHAAFTPANLLPEKTTHYHYMGSLTTPPCTEGVNWNVLNTPLEISAEQWSAFKKLYSENNRPVQELKSRKPANF